MLDAYNASDMPLILWSPIMPGAGPLRLLSYAKGNKVPVRWFSPVSARDFKPSIKNRLATKYIVHMGRFCGTKFPCPEFVSLEDALTVAESVAEVINTSGGCCIHAGAGASVRICQFAIEKGLDFSKAVFIVSSEPLTPAKHREIEATGAVVYPTFATIESGRIGTGCLYPEDSDDTHFFSDTFAVIQHPRKVPHAAVSVDAFLFTSLLIPAPKVLLNTESGDYGTIQDKKLWLLFRGAGIHRACM
jgi:hypothetical protein